MRIGVATWNITEGWIHTLEAGGPAKQVEAPPPAVKARASKLGLE